MEQQQKGFFNSLFSKVHDVKNLIFPMIAMPVTKEAHSLVVVVFSVCSSVFMYNSVDVCSLIIFYTSKRQ